MKAFIVTFDGMWHGGRAVVVAKDADRAIILVKQRMSEDENLQGFKGQETDRVARGMMAQHIVLRKEPYIIHYDNGDE